MQWNVAACAAMRASGTASMRQNCRYTASYTMRAKVYVSGVVTPP